MAKTAAKVAKRPDDKQQDALLAGFLRLASYLERPVSEPELRAACPIPENGADIETLDRLAGRFDFEIEIIDARRRRLVTTSPPFLLLGETPSQTRLVRGRTGSHLVVVDPITGTSNAQSPKAAAVDAKTIVKMQPKARRKVSGDRLWHDAILGRLKPVLWEIGLSSVFINILALTTPIFMMTVYNKVIGNGAIHTLDVLAIGMITLFGFELALRMLRGYVVSHTGARLDLAISRDVFHHLLQMPYRVFENMPSGQMLERMRQLDQLRNFLTGNLPLLLVDLCFVGLFVTVIFMLSPTLGGVTLAVMPFFILMSALAHRRQRKLIGANFRAGAGKASCINEALGNALTVKALALESEMERRFEERHIESAWSGFKAGGVANAVGSAGQVLQHAAGLLIVYLGAKMIIAGELSIGALIACTILSTRALAPMRQIFFAWHQIQQARDSFKRLGDLMRERTEQAQGTLPVPGQLRGRIRIEDLTFTYGENKPAAVHNFGLDIPAGTMMAVVGPPGSGKSTLAKLVAGLEKPHSGRVLIDDLDVAHLSPAGVRSQIGFVPQEVQLFSGTIAENIAMASVDRSFARVVAAAKFVGLHDTIERLPEGYDTKLGERGAGLSLGQRQLVTIARALVRNPRILILDEVTSALDTASETLLLHNLKRAGAGRTILLITHRISVLNACDHGVLIEQGEIAALGPPAEIRARLRRPVKQAGLQAVN